MENKNVQIIVFGIIAAILLPIAFTSLSRVDYTEPMEFTREVPYGYSGVPPVSFNITSTEKWFNVSFILGEGNFSYRDIEYTIACSNDSLLNTPFRTITMNGSTVIADEELLWNDTNVFDVGITDYTFRVRILFTSPIAQNVTLTITVFEVEYGIPENGETINTFTHVLYPILLMFSVLVGIVGYIDHKRKN